MDVDLDGASTLSVAAFALSVVSIWFGVLRPWWKTREAHPEARLEKLSYREGESPWRTDDRLVIVNHGPAVMRQVTAQLIDANGEEHTLSPRSRWPSMPIPEIHVGQLLHLPVVLEYGKPQLRSAVLSWRDGRPKAQQRTFWVTWQRVT